MELYEQLKAQASTGIDRKWIKKAARITVSSYHKDLLENLAYHPVAFSKYGKLELMDNWYILEDWNLYRDDVGLDIWPGKEISYAL